MEILKKGVSKNETNSYKRARAKYIRKCRDCGCIFVYERREINSWYDAWCYVWCPHCHCCNEVMFRKRYIEKKEK